MKKWFVGLFIIGIVVGLFVNVDFGVPQPTIKADGKLVKVVQGPYCWSGLFKSECASTSIPPELIESNNVKPTKVAPETEIVITFKNQPSEVGVNLWSEDNSVGVIMEDNFIIAPKEPGIYIYDVFGRWPNGDSASSAFSIEVHQ